MEWNFESPYSTIIKWSKTQDNCWRECKRKFYYQYRAATRTSRHPRKAEIAELKKLKSIPILIGEIVHDAIANFIIGYYDYRTTKTPMIYFYSRWEKTADKLESSLIEFTNGINISDRQVKEAKEHCEILIANFTEMWQPIKDKEMLYVDTPGQIANWFKCGQYGVYAKPDLIIKDEKYRLIDWKTGQELDDDMENNLQMSASIFLACYDAQGNVRNFPHEFEGYFYYLKTKSISGPAIRSIDDYGKFVVFVEKRISSFPQTEDIEDYPADAAKWKCIRCQFATICEDGRQFIYVQI